MYVLRVNDIVDFSTVPGDVISLRIESETGKLLFDTPIPHHIEILHIHCISIDFLHTGIFHDRLIELYFNVYESLNEKILIEIAQSNVIAFGYAWKFPFDVKYLPKYVTQIISYRDVYYFGDFPFDKIRMLRMEDQFPISYFERFVNVHFILGTVIVDTHDFKLPELRSITLVCYPNVSLSGLMANIKKNWVNLYNLTIVMVDNGSKFDAPEYEFDLTDTNIKEICLIHDTTTILDSISPKKRIVFVSLPKFSENLKKLKLKEYWNRSSSTYDQIPLDDLPISLVALSMVSSKTNLDFSRFVNMKNLKIAFDIEQKAPIVSQVENKIKLDDLFDQPEEFPVREDCLIKVYPPHLEKLSIMVNRFKLDQFPETLKELSITGRRCQIQKLPSQLTHLTLDIYAQANEIVFPETLTHLSCYEFFYDIRSLPANLLSLEIRRLNTNNDLLFLSNLQKLHTLKIESYNIFYCTRNKNIVFPESLRVLHIDRGCDSIIPPFIEELYYI